MGNSLHERIHLLELTVKDQAETIKYLLDIVGYGTDRFYKYYLEEEQGPLPDNRKAGANLMKLVKKLADEEKDIDPD